MAIIILDHINYDLDYYNALGTISINHLDVLVVNDIQDKQAVTIMNISSLINNNKEIPFIELIKKLFYYYYFIIFYLL